LWRLDWELYLRQGACFVGTDHGNSTKRFHSRKGLAKNLILLHDIGHDSKTHRQGDGETFRDKSNSDADAVDNKQRNTNPRWMIPP